MIGVFVLLVSAIYVWVAYVITKRMPSRKAKYVVVAAFVLIPVWDVVPEWFYLQYLCRTEGGMKIHKTVDGVEGFRDTVSLGIVNSALLKHGYKYVEGKNKTRYYRDSAGNVVKEGIENYLSRYELTSQMNVELPLTLYMNEWRIIDRKTNETLATMKNFTSAGGWIKNLMSPILGFGFRCRSEPNVDVFYTRTLHPKLSTN